MRVAVIDIGKPGKNLGWAIDEPDEEATDIDACIEKLIVSLGKGPVALGFEAPQFVPIRHDPLALLAGRKGDFGRHSRPRLVPPFSSLPWLLCPTSWTAFAKGCLVPRQASIGDTL